MCHMEAMSSEGSVAMLKSNQKVKKQINPKNKREYSEQGGRSCDPSDAAGSPREVLGPVMSCPEGSWDPKSTPKRDPKELLGGS